MIVLPAAAQEYHTSPYCWSDARTYASGEMERIEASVTRIEADRKIEGNLSPNGAYRFDITGRLTDSDPEWHPKLIIYSERPYLLQVQFPNTEAISKAEWINENLVYVRLWWGRIAGSDIIVDAEKETVLYEQPIRYGAIAFQQYKQCSEETWEGEGQCQCIDSPDSSKSSAE